MYYNKCMSDMVTVREYVDEIEAEVARARLEAAGIDASVLRDDCGGIHLQNISSSFLIVDGKDRDHAVSVLDSESIVALPDDFDPPEEEQESEVVQDSLFNRLEESFGPVLGGIIIDLMDLATFGPIGLLCGMIVGVLIAYWIGGIYNLDRRSRIVLSILAGIYCTVPLTEVFPLATLIGAYARYRRGVK